MAHDETCTTCGASIMARPPRGAALSDIRAWDRAMARHRETHTADHIDCVCGWSRIVLSDETEDDARRAHEGTAIHALAMAERRPVKRGRARVCGDCWYVLRPGDYLPGDTYGTDGTCSMCGGWAYALHRVAWSEIDATRA